jgi:hypothetical protein
MRKRDHTMAVTQCPLDWPRDTEGEVYYADPEGGNGAFDIIECTTCQTPMAVLREHTMWVEWNVLIAMVMELKKVADELFGSGNWVIRMKQRTSKGHLHFHAVGTEQRCRKRGSNV